MSRDYKKDITINHDGATKFGLYTETKLQVATGYNRIVFGQRGPYIEFTKEQAIKSAMYIPKDKAWKMLKKYADKIDYIEMRTNLDNVKVYFQRKRVDYADYKPGFIYISPFDLYDESGDVIIKKVGAKEPVIGMDSEGNIVLKKKAPFKIPKKDKEFAYDRAHKYLTSRFESIDKIKKADMFIYKGKKTILGTKVKELDSLLTVCVIHTNNLECDDSHIAIHFKSIALRELDKVCKKYYLVKERREPVLVELEYMFIEKSKKKIKEEYDI